MNEPRVAKDRVQRIRMLLKADADGPAWPDSKIAKRSMSVRRPSPGCGIAACSRGSSGIGMTPFSVPQLMSVCVSSPKWSQTGAQGIPPVSQFYLPDSPVAFGNAANVIVSQQERVISHLKSRFLIEVSLVLRFLPLVPIVVIWNQGRSSIWIVSGRHPRLEL